jgi:hypothetical protein
VLKWNILILTMPSRLAYLMRLKSVLDPQLCPSVEVTIRTSDPKMTRGANRVELMKQSEAEYINFLDDDDLVPEDFVESILPLLDGVDYIGFQVQLYYGGPEQNVKELPTFHSLRYPQWSSTNEGHYRDLSHLNPIKRELALQAADAMARGNGNEDVMWADAMRGLGIVKTEHYVDKIMYHYYCRPGHTD